MIMGRLIALISIKFLFGERYQDYGFRLNPGEIQSSTELIDNIFYQNVIMSLTLHQKQIRKTYLQ